MVAADNPDQLFISKGTIDGLSGNVPGAAGLVVYDLVATPPVKVSF